MAPEPTLPQFLAQLSGQGIYNADIVHELERYGFSYDSNLDLLILDGRSTPFGARPASVAASEDDDNAIDMNRVRGNVVDATEITRAILRLIDPGNTAPSLKAFRRTKGFRKDVERIARIWRQN